MSVLINENTKVIVQGITGKQATFHTKKMLEFGTKIVAGVTPGKAGQTVEGVPVFNCVADAVKATGANASVIYVPPRFAADSIMEGVEAGLDLVVCITEHIPVEDMVKVRRFMEGKKTRVIGPNCPGVMTPGEGDGSKGTKLGIIPANIMKKGHVGLISRSGTLTYEAAFQLMNAGIGITTAIGIGGDPVKGTDFIDCLELFKNDPETEAILMIGEIGGTAEEDAAKWIQENMPDKPVAAFIAGRQAPPGKRMGHAGAIIAGGKGTAADKIKALNAVDIPVADTVAHIGETVVEHLKKRGKYDICHTC
jgi:succinyl-CoA synthetase alpha subunit